MEDVEVKFIINSVKKNVKYRMTHCLCLPYLIKNIVSTESDLITRFFLKSDRHLPDGRQSSDGETRTHVSKVTFHDVWVTHQVHQHLKTTIFKSVPLSVMGWCCRGHMRMGCTLVQPLESILSENEFVLHVFNFCNYRTFLYSTTHSTTHHWCVFN